MLSNLITDRSLADYNRWAYLRDKGYANMTDAERAEWGEDLKGAYNASDLNRVSNALNYMLSRFQITGYLGGNEFNLKSTWINTDIPTADDFGEYLRAVSVIREAMAQYADTPPTPADTGSLDYNEANDIEKIILDIEKLINLMLKARFYMGELFCGEI